MHHPLSPSLPTIPPFSHSFLLKEIVYATTDVIFNSFIATDEIDLPHLKGNTNHGDSIGDLWFITYLLKQLTLEIDGLVVKYVNFKTD